MRKHLGDVRRLLMSKTKICPDCKRELDFSFFYRRNGSRSKEVISKCKDCHREYYRLATIKRKQDIVNMYGGKCECCGDTNIEFLTIDHIHSNGYIERKRIYGREFYKELLSLGSKREDLRLLCMNCNFSIAKYGYCPHIKKGIV